MPIEITSAFKLELASLEQDYLVELFEIDLTNKTNSKGETGRIYRFHNGMNTLKTNVTWLGNEYIAYPIRATGFELSGQGTSPRPTLTISNLFGLVTAIVNDFEDGLGARVTRRQVFAKNLDPVNFVGGKNPNYDTSKEVIQYFVIEQLKSLNAEQASFTLALPSETDNALLPARSMMSDTCTWLYRSPECGYTGGAVADEKDQPTTDLKKDKCSKCLTGCKLRNNVRNFGAFIAINKLS